MPTTILQNHFNLVFEASENSWDLFSSISCMSSWICFWIGWKSWLVAASLFFRLPAQDGLVIQHRGQLKQDLASSIMMARKINMMAKTPNLNMMMLLSVNEYWLCWMLWLWFISSPSTCYWICEFPICSSKWFNAPEDIRYLLSTCNSYQSEQSFP